MDIELTPEESSAVQAALRNYISSLRMEIVDTDNAAFKRDLKQERDSLESALAKLDANAGGHEPGGEPTSGDPTSGEVIRVVRIWWATGA